MSGNKRGSHGLLDKHIVANVCAKGDERFSAVAGFLRDQLKLSESDRLFLYCDSARVGVDFSRVRKH